MKYSPRKFVGLIRYYFKVVFSSWSGPSILAIELTNTCNANCVMCDHPSMIRKKGHMDFDLFKKIVDDANKNNVKIFQLSFYGEPLLYHKLVEAAAYISESAKEAEIIINTNAFYLDEKIAMELIDAGITLFSVSIDGNNKEEFEKIRVGLNYERVYKNVKNLAALILQKKSVAKVHVRGLHLKDVKIDEEEFNETWGPYADKVIVRNDHYLCSMEKESIVHKVLPCNKIFNQMIVMVNGDVTMCAFDWQGEMTYGNISTMNMRELWKTKPLRYKRLKHMVGLKKTIPFCSDCSYRAFSS